MRKIQAQGKGTFVKHFKVKLTKTNVQLTQNERKPMPARGGAGNRNQKVFAAANHVKECGKALHPNVFVAAPFLSGFFFEHLIPILQQ